MSFYNDPMKRTLNRINESIMEMPTEIEPTIGVDTPAEIKQCPSCKCTYKGAPVACPVCGMEFSLKESRRLKKRSRRFEADGDMKDPYNQETAIMDDDVTIDPDATDIILNEEDEDLPADVEVKVEEALDCLSDGETKKFNESFGRFSKLTRNGRLNLVLESKRTGRMYSVVRRINSVQKANFKLSESARMSTPTARRKALSKRLEAVRTARMKAITLNEMRAIKVAALRLMERQGVHFDFKRMNEAIDQEIANRADDVKLKIEEAEADQEIGAATIADATPEEIGEVVTTALNDVGLQTVTNTVESDETEDSATVQVRVQDDPAIEVPLESVADTVADMVDAPVAIVGPSKPEGDSTLADLTVLINPEDIEDAKETAVALSESLRKKVRRSRRRFECDMNSLNTDKKVLDEDEDEVEDEEKEEIKLDIPKLSERRRTARRKKFRKESVDVDIKDRELDEDDETIEVEDKEIVDESVKVGKGDYYALVIISSRETTDPKFIGNDGNIVSGSEEKSEERIHLFPTADAAIGYADINGITDVDAVSVVIEGEGSVELD